MQTQILNLALAFLEGTALIFSPCILPILPIVLSGSIDGSRRRPYGIIIGFVICFALFTFFSRTLVSSFGLDLNLVRYVSFALLLLFGIIMLSDYLTEKFNRLTQGVANIGFKLSNNAPQSGFFSGVWFGSLIALVWTPCAGPILAAVIVQSILQTSNLQGFLTILAFAIGAAIPMLIIILFGRALTKNISFLSKHSILLRKIMAIIIILAVLAMIFVPDLFIPSAEQTPSKVTLKQGIAEGVETPYAAPDFAKITAWINSEPLNIQSLHGKVVLIDFWAYSCINCIRTLPYLKDWYEKYHDQGFIIVGVHSPEFDFERLPENVRKAVKQYSISYPVALDNDFATWQNYKNHYWPAHYLIDQNGKVVYEHWGEGAYEVTEHNIRTLLGINTPMQSKALNATNNHRQTPETYLGYKRMATFAGTEKISKDQMAKYEYPATLEESTWALNGAWIIAGEKIVSAQKNAGLKLNFYAKDVFAVIANSSKQPIKVTVLLNGVESKTFEVLDSKLYDLFSSKDVANGTIELVASDPGLEVYTFTFG